MQNNGVINDRNTLPVLEIESRESGDNILITPGAKSIYDKGSEMDDDSELDSGQTKAKGEEL